MQGAIDDFSTLVAIKTPTDLLQRPLYHLHLNPEESKLAEVLAPYSFDEPYPCGISSCRTPHQSGYLVRTEDNKETNIGGICGVRIFGDDFQIKAHVQDQRARLKHQVETLNAVHERQAELLQRISELLNRELGVKWADATLRSFKEAVGHVVSRKLHQRAVRGEVVVDLVREATAEERERQQAFTGKSQQYITEKKGELIGLEFLNQHPERMLTDLKNRLYELQAFDTVQASARARNEWISWAGSIERTFEEAEGALASALRFFSQANLNLLPFLATDAKDKEKLAKLRWSTAERRVVSD